MSIQNNLKRALINQNNWAKSGHKAAAKYNKAHGTNHVHDVAVVSPFILSEPDEVKAMLISRDGLAVLKEDVHGIHLKENGSTSFSSFYTYILTIVGRKFGPNSVRIDISNDPYGFRGFEGKPEVIEYAQTITKITIDRIKFRLTKK